MQLSCININRIQAVSTLLWRLITRIRCCLSRLIDSNAIVFCFVLYSSPTTGLRLRSQQSELRRSRQRRRRQSGQRRRQQHGPHQLHHQTVDGTGERIPLQQIPDQSPADRNRRRFAVKRDAGQNLVPEPADETEEAHEGGTHSTGTDAVHFTFSTFTCHRFREQRQWRRTLKERITAHSALIRTSTRHRSNSNTRGHQSDSKGKNCSARIYLSRRQRTKDETCSTSSNNIRPLCNSVIHQQILVDDYGSVWAKCEKLRHNSFFISSNILVFRGKRPISAVDGLTVQRPDKMAALNAEMDPRQKDTTKTQCRYKYFSWRTNPTPRWERVQTLKWLFCLIKRTADASVDLPLNEKGGSLIPFIIYSTGVM